MKTRKDLNKQMFNQCAYENKERLLNKQMFNQCAYENKERLLNKQMFNQCAYENKERLKQTGVQRRFIDKSFKLRNTTKITMKIFPFVTNGIRQSTLSVNDISQSFKAMIHSYVISFIHAKQCKSLKKFSVV